MGAHGHPQRRALWQILERSHDSRIRLRDLARLTVSRAVAREIPMETEGAVMAQERAGEPGDPCVMVILGASGDLTKRKLIPALYNLAKDNLLSREFALIGVGRADLSHEQFREKCSEDVKQFATAGVDPDLWHWFVRRMYYVRGNF